MQVYYYQPPYICNKIIIILIGDLDLLKLMDILLYFREVDSNIKYWPAANISITDKVLQNVLLDR
jgi:hypothetical protein